MSEAFDRVNSKPLLPRFQNHFNAFFFVLRFYVLNIARFSIALRTVLFDGIFFFRSKNKKKNIRSTTLICMPSIKYTLIKSRLNARLFLLFSR